ncbi:MAG: ATP-binding protein, partial [Nanoarchaeota archaeon]
MEEKSSYSAKDITVLAGLSAIRKRPSMYIGSTGIRGLHHLVYEIVDNSIDEAMAGYCNNIKVVIHANGKVSVADDGRGIPVEMHPKYNKPTLEIIMTKLHSGGKFDKNSYKVSGGLHGVGLAVVNALSIELDVFIKREGSVYTQKYKQGKPVSQLREIGKDEATGTMISFLPDPEIFPETKFQFDILASRLRELAFLNKGIKITLTDEVSGEKKVFFYEGGITSFVEYLNKSKQPVHEIIFLQKTKNDVVVELAMQYNSGFKENVFSFVNNINTIEGGTHLSGFKTALTRTINTYVAKNFSKDLKLTSEDVREGLTAVLSVKVPEPQFEGQTKTKLGNSEVKGIVDSSVSEAFSTFLEENPKVAST